MRRDRSWLLLPFVAWVGACSDSVTATPADVPRDQSTVDGTALPDVTDERAPDVIAVDNGPDASVDDVTTPDDVITPDDVTKPPVDVTTPDDVFVEDVTLADVPVTPPDVPVTPDVPVAPDVPVTPPTRAPRAPTASPTPAPRRA